MSNLIAKSNEIKVGFDKPRSDVSYAWGEGCNKADALVLKEALFHLKDSNGKTVVEQLKERGFDIETLKLSIKKLN